MKLNSSGEGLLIFILLATIINIVFKETCVPELSWWLVFIPIWLPVAAAITVFCLLAVMCVVFGRQRDKEDKFQEERGEQDPPC